MRRIAILKTGSTRLTQTVARRGGDYESWFAETLVPLGVQVEVLDAVGGELPDRNDWDGVVITGSPASVHHREPWSEAAGRWIARRVAKGMPTLGVCYGHQLLADALGGDTGPSHTPELGLYDVELLAEDPLFTDLPSPWPSFEIHYDEVTQLPRDAKLLARSPRCAVQAFGIANHVRAVQWHPEFDAFGVREAIDQDADNLRRIGMDPTELRDRVEEQPLATKILENFIKEFVR